VVSYCLGKTIANISFSDCRQEQKLRDKKSIKNQTLITCVAKGNEGSVHTTTPARTLDQENSMEARLESEITYASSAVNK